MKMVNPVPAAGLGKACARTVGHLWIRDPAGAISVVLRIEEELLCKTKSSRESAVLGGYFFLQFN